MRISELKKNKIAVVAITLTGFLLFTVVYMFAIRRFFGPANNASDYREPYLEFLSQVYEEMDENYYMTVSRETYKEFLAEYKERILPQVEDRRGRVDEVAHLGAGLLVTRLRAPEDNFTNFIPPEKAKEYKEEIYSYADGIGIDGMKVDNVFLITQAEIRSGAYREGIRENDILLAVNNVPVEQLSEEEIRQMLYPPLDTEVDLVVAKVATQEVLEYTVTATQYYRQTVEEVPTPIDGLLYLRMATFNRSTEEDLKRILRDYGVDNIEFLILDVRDNPGGPPLAVHAISSIFLGPGRNLFYYTKKNVPEFGLVSPETELRYEGPMVVVVNEKSGSASELLAGTLQAYDRAIIAGPSRTAGFAFLKGLSDFEDGSTLAMITGWAHLFDGQPFSEKGVEPDLPVPEDVENVPVYVINQLSAVIAR